MMSSAAVLKWRPPLRRLGCLCASAAADGVVATSETVNGKLQQRQEEVEELNAVS